MVERVTTTSPELNEQAPEGHDEAMAALADAGAIDGAAATPPEPEAAPKLAGKFDTPEDLEKAYTELAKKLGEPKVDEPKEPEAEPIIADNVEADAAKDVVEKAGLDFDAMQTEFTDKGELSAETLKTLKDVGIGQEMVDAYIAGQNSLADSAYNDMMSVAGGDDAYSAMMDWAADNLSESEIDAYNATIDKGDVGATKLAISGIKARQEAGEGVEPTLTGGKSTASDGTAYESWAQVTADMNDPRYATDHAFRTKVDNRLAKSKI